MAKNQKTNGHIPAGKALEESEFYRLVKKGMSRQSIDHFGHDFVLHQQAMRRAFVDGQLPLASMNALRGSYGNDLRMIDAQIRARKMGYSSPKAKLLNP